MNARLADGNGDVAFGQLFFDPAIEKFVLEEEAGIVVANGRFDQALGVARSGRADHFQSGRVHVPHLGILRMEWPAAHAATGGAANHHGSRRAPAIVGLRHRVHDLRVRGADEVHELKFGNRTHAGERGSEGGANDGRFGDGGVDNALRAEAVDEAVCDFERAAVNADVFADAEDGGIAIHFFLDALADGFKIGEEHT